MRDACITFTNLTLGYESHPAVHHLDGIVRRGSLTAIVGANGSGKSTLMKGMVGVLRPMDGAVAHAVDARIAYLPQQSELDRTFPASVVDLVSMGLWPRRGLLGRHRAEDRAAVRNAIHAVGLSGFEHRVIGTLSGGQLQRALFARVLVQDASLILLDEPFNAVDARTQTELLEIIAGWHAEGRTVMVVVHDHDMVRKNFPETLLIARQPVAWGPTRDVLTPDNLLRARRFHEAWDEAAPWCEPEAEHAPGPGGQAHHAHDHAGHSHNHAHAPHGERGAA